MTLEEASGFSRRYAAILAVPPLLIAVPVALWFLNHALIGEYSASVLTIAIFATYIAGAAVFAVVVARSADAVEQAVAGDGDVSKAASECLERTASAAFAVWMGWGVVVALALAMFFDASFAGLQQFVEAALIVAAFGMAWSYWAGKRLLLSYVPADRPLLYRGNVYPIRVKIAMVFIGFFFVSMGAVVQLISSRLTSRLAQAGIPADDITSDITRYALIVVALTAVVFAAATWLLARDVTGPLDALISSAGDMAQGRLDGQSHVFADDEVGTLAGSFAATRGNLRTLIGRIGSSGGTVASGVRVMTEGTETLLSGARQQDTLAAQTTSALELVRKDARSVLDAVDKVSSSTLDSAGRASELSASFTEVSHRMDELMQSVEKSSSSTLQIDATAREMSARTSNLANVGNEVLAFVAEMDASVEQITRTAESTATLSTEVRGNAIAGREAVDATVEGIRAAQESTRRTAGAFEALQKSLGDIDRILDFIGELTNQTNLLSLNAAIIAAQAGANDFGFSVIADEVRQLADRTRTATKEIAGIIRNVQPVAREAVDAIEEGVTNVDRTVRLAQAARESLGTILTSSDRSLDMVQNMTRAMQEQTQASRHLHDVVANVSDTIGEISRATQAQADSTRLLAEEAERVRDIALRVKKATEEQTVAGRGINEAMEQISEDVRVVRERLERQLASAEEIAAASKVTLTIAKRNNALAEEFTSALQSLLESGNTFQGEVGRFRV